MKAIIALAVVWSLVWGGGKIANSLRVTPEKTANFLEENDLASIDDGDRRKEVLAELADMLNAMEPDEVQQFQESMFSESGEGDGNRRRLFENLSDEEQWYFMERRIGRAFEQMMQAFNEMDREERKKIVDRTVRQMRSDDDSDRRAIERLEGQDREMFEKISNEGFRAYYEDASAETKLDLAPVLEEMQKFLGGGRGPR